jgi:hypothetical protein
MLQILYIVAFTALSLFAVANLIRSMISLAQNDSKAQKYPASRRFSSFRTIHPELIDDNGNVTDEPLLVMRPMNFDDARLRLDAIYNSSPNADS